MTAPLVIAYRGNFRHGFCTERHVEASLQAMGHTVVRLQEDQTTWAACVTAAEQAQVFLWTKTWSLDEAGGHAALGAIRDSGTPSASFHLDRYVGLDREEQITHDPFWRTDAVFTADGGSAEAFAAYGVNHYWLPPAVWDAECTIGRANRRRYPERVVFVGSHPYPHPEWRPYRDELLSRLQAHLGDRFGIYPRVRSQPIRGRELADLYATADVVIGDSCLSGDPRPEYYWSDRIPEVVGRRGLLIHPEVVGLDEWYEDGRHLLTYPVGDFDTLLALVDEYLEDETTREAIRTEGQALVMERDTYRHRMASVLDRLGIDFGIPAPRVRVPASATVRATRERTRLAPAAARTTTRPGERNRMMVSGRTGRPVEPAGVELMTVRHARSRQPARFELAQGDTDRTAVQEVWGDDTYRLTPADVTGRVVVDVGANVGAFSVLAARMGAASVHAYEPHPESHAVLLRNLDRNAVTRLVTAHRCAVLDRTRVVELIGAGGGAHVGGAGDGHQVDAVGLNDVIDLAAPGGRVGYLKVDCEGAEYEQFAGIDGDHLARVDQIAMEWHGPLMGPHLTHLDDDGHWYDRWAALLYLLADHGRVETFGHPRVGGILRFRHY